MKCYIRSKNYIFRWKSYMRSKDQRTIFRSKNYRGRSKNYFQSKNYIQLKNYIWSKNYIQSKNYICRLKSYIRSADRINIFDQRTLLDRRNILDWGTIFADRRTIFNLQIEKLFADWRTICRFKNNRSRLKNYIWLKN